MLASGFKSSFLLMFLAFAGSQAVAETAVPPKVAEPEVTRAPDPEAEAADKAIMALPDPVTLRKSDLGALSGRIPTSDGVAAEQLQKDKPEVQPSGGIDVFERMGAPLPPLPPEKPFKGKIDEAYGAYQRGLYMTAMDLSIPRAKAGDPAAQTLIAEILRNGEGMPRDLKQAAFWYQKAADGGDPNAMLQYSLLLLNGGSGVARDKAKSDQYMEKAAKAGQPVAAFNWALVLVSQKPGPEGMKAALPFYEVSAQKGIPDSQYALSQIYLNLPGIPDEKRATARDWLVKAAVAGYDTAQYDLAAWLINGTEGEQDVDNGFKWMKLAAANGNVLAQNKLSHLYINAIGTRPDPVEAIKWYVLSRRAGLKDLELEDFFLGVEDETQKKGIEAANQYRLN